MCFSTEASFTAALVLGIAGGAILKNHSSPPQFFLAAIPLLFAIQQFSEGLVWLHLSHHVGSESLFLNAQRLFLIFAFLIWPIWIPLSLVILEQVPWRRLLLSLNFAGGIALSLWNLSYGIHQEPNVQIVNYSLHYLGKVPTQALIYPFIVLLPFFLSSLKNLWIFGILILLSYCIAAYFYTATFTSVWCFFAAIVSLSVYKVLKDNPLVLEKHPF